MAEQTSTEDTLYAHRWLVLFATCLALFMIVLDSTVVNISIPSLIRDLHATLPQAEWVLNAYTLTFAALLITFGRLGDMFGHRRMFILGMSIFGLGSLACGLSASPEMLIGFRVLQASGSAFMMPATLAIITMTFPPQERGRALGIWGAVSGVGLGVGPLLGGFFTQIDWRYIFFINLPVVLFAIPLTALVIGVRLPTRRHRLDWVGVALTIGLLTAFNYAMIQGPSAGWTDPLIVSLLVAAAVMLAAFVWWEGRAEEPLMDLTLFRDRTFTFGNLAAALLLFTMLGVFFLMPLFLQSQLHYSPLQTGVTLAPLSIAMMIAAPISGRMSDVFGSRWLAAAGLVVTAVAVWWMSYLSPTITSMQLAPRYLLAGFGMGLVLAPVTAAVMSQAPRGREGGVSGVLATTRQVGATLGVAVLGAVLQAQVSRQFAIWAGVAGISGATARQEAFVFALGTTLRVAALVALAGAVSALMIAPTPRPHGREERAQRVTVAGA